MITQTTNSANDDPSLTSSLGVTNPWGRSMSQVEIRLGWEEISKLGPVVTC